MTVKAFNHPGEIGLAFGGKTNARHGAARMDTTNLRDGGLVTLHARKYRIWTQ
jgi:hypothetical protein